MPEGADFTYPYRILQQPDKGPDRRYRPDLSRLRGYLGTFDCLIEVHTPLEVNYDQNAHFNKAPKIPGASMKGIIRSIVEFVGHGCMSISSHDRNDGRWELCGDQACCAACDMFGRLVRGKGGQINRGKVFIGDALPQTWDRHKQLAIYQGRPKEEHRAFYPKSGQYCYRKFYLHQPSAQQTAAKHSEKHVNDLFPVAPGSTFAFRVDFEGMEAAEVAVLAWGLELEPGLLHKLGRGKAHGLGSVKIRILTRRIQPVADRYQGKDPAATWPPEVERELKTLRSDRRLDGLRKVLSWEAAKRIGPVKYPRHSWFQSNSEVALRSVDDLMPGPALVADDPPLPDIQRDLGRSARSTTAPTGQSMPDGFDEKLWEKLSADDRSIVREILAIRSYKSESRPYIDKFQKEGAKEERKRAIVEAMHMLVPKRKHSWLRDKFGANYLPASEEPPPPRQEAASPLEAASETLESLTDVKHIGKKVLSKHWKSLDDDERRKLATRIKTRCEDLGKPDAPDRLKDLAPYL